ncbi:hypothetical protein CCP3SC15_2270005 [Gammaproteobacteria bacterium]
MSKQAWNLSSEAHSQTSKAFFPETEAPDANPKPPEDEEAAEEGGETEEDDEGAKPSPKPGKPGSKPPVKPGQGDANDESAEDSDDSEDAEDSEAEADDEEKDDAKPPKRGKKAFDINNTANHAFAAEAHINARGEHWKAYGEAKAQGDGQRAYIHERMAAHHDELAMCHKSRMCSEEDACKPSAPPVGYSKLV